MKGTSHAIFQLSFVQNFDAQTPTGDVLELS